MKKFGIGVLFLLAVCVTQAYVVDNFEPYASGQVEAVTTDWTAVPAGYGNTFIGADFRNPLNQVLTAVGQWGQGRGGFRTLPAEACVPEGATKTMFIRFRASNNATDHSFGLTNVDAPSTWNDFRTQVAIVGGSIRARNGGSTVILSNIAHGWGQPFYNVWVVVDNASDTYHVYMNQGEADATEANRLTSTAFSFRSASAEDLDTFFFFSNNNDQRLWFDDLCIMDGASLVNPLRYAAHHPSPAYKIAGVNPFDLQLSWNTAIDPVNPAQVNPNVTGHCVYYVNEPNELGMTASPVIPVQGTAGAYTTTLLEDSTYYWCVETILNNRQPGDANNIMGPMWMFDTQKSFPVISVQPTEQRVPENAPAVFRVEFSSVSTAQATWKKIVNGVESTVSQGVSTVADGTAYVSTLTVNGIEANEAMYYCQITNGTQVDSDVVALVVKRRLAYYPFENSYQDVEGGIHGIGKDNADPVDPNNPSNPPAFVQVTDSPRGGYALALDGLGQYVDFGPQGTPRAGGLANGIGAGLDAGTVVCWVKVTAPGGILSNYNDGLTTGFGLSVTGGLNARINVRGEGPAGEYQEIGTAEGRPAAEGFSLSDGTWHLVAATWQGNTVRVFVDGGQVASATGVVPAQFLGWQRGMLLGGTRTSANRGVLSTTFFGGLVDELEVYNYPWTAEQMAQKYYDETQIRTCLYPNFEGSIYNLDNTGTSYCKVDLADFAMFAHAWMAEGLYPGL
jgi:hypothetical protein